MDIFPTLLSLADVTPPSDRHYDGIDATSVLLHGGQSGHEVRYSFCCPSCSGLLKWLLEKQLLLAEEVVHQGLSSPILLAVSLPS